MSTNQFKRLLWLVTLLRRYGRLTRTQINTHWRTSPYGNGRDIPRRTFYNIREEIGTMFNIMIDHDVRTN